MVARLLQLAHQIVDVCNRGGSELLNDGRDLRVSLWLRSRLCASKIANVAFSHQVRGYSLEVRHLKFHKMIPSWPIFHYLRRRLMGGDPSGPQGTATSSRTNYVTTPVSCTPIRPRAPTHARPPPPAV